PRTPALAKPTCSRTWLTQLRQRVGPLLGSIAVANDPRIGQRGDRDPLRGEALIEVPRGSATGGQERGGGAARDLDPHDARERMQHARAVVERTALGDDRGVLGV